MAGFSSALNRELAIYIDRKGKVHSVSIGDSSTVGLPEFDVRTSRLRLSGIRCIHTHPRGSAIFSDLDLKSLLTLRLDAIVALGVKDGQINDVGVALPKRNSMGIIDDSAISGPYNRDELPLNKFFEEIIQIDKTHIDLLHDNEQAAKEKAVLVSTDQADSLEELEELAKTAGVIVLDKILQTNAPKNSATFAAKGMTEKISHAVQLSGANLVIFDDELSGMQVRNLEEIIGKKVIDRTTLILDIFAMRARSKEGKLQVELAQLRYMLPRLTGFGTALSRLGGGIGTRGPGEKKLETDKRHINRRIHYLENELKDVGKRRTFLREGRKKQNLPTVSLVGYTNAGKSTLLNRLSNSDVFVEDKLFATLDPTARGLVLPDGREILLIDTVGFIRKLPHDLVDAFKSTLEEAVYSDVLLHVVDISDDEADMRIKVVDNLLDSIGAGDKTEITVFNKIDLAGEKTRTTAGYSKLDPVEISAKTGEGTEKLLKRISEALPRKEISVVLFIPFHAAKMLNFVYENAKITDRRDTEDGVEIKAVMDKEKADKVRMFIKS